VINKEIPENEKVQIKSLGKDDTESLPVDATYKVEEVVVTPPAPTKPATTPDAEIKPEDVPAPIVTVEGIGVIPVVVQENSNQTGLDLIGQDWTIAIDSTKKLVQGTTEDSSSRVVIEKGNTVTTNGTGFKPNTQVDVWVYSTATWLGAVMTDEFGNFVTTLPMPTALPEGEHTFQAKGQTPEGLIRSASVPITLVPAVANLGSLKFSVFYPMDSIALSANEKKTIRTKVKAALKAKPKNAKFIVEIVGWVQPTRVSPRIKYLSDGRANAVRKYIQSLGLKGEFVLNAPGHDKVNISASRRADVVISWSAVQPV
jgi:outer membrane protein OmpA-like peptidoglycan-associated protein